MSEKRVIFKHAEKAVLIVVLLLSFLLRFIGIDFGYPLKLHTDEWAIVNYSVDMADNNTLFAEGYNRPDNPVKKVSAVLYKLYSMGFNGTKFSEEINKSNPTIYNIISRCYVAFLGALTVFIVWLIGKRFNKWFAILAAMFFSVYPLFVEHSHYATSDISLTLALCLCIYFALLYFNKQSHWCVVVMALFGALGTLDKYCGIITCAVIAASIIVCNWGKWKRFIYHGVIALSAYVLIMFIISPNLFFDLKNVIAAAAQRNEKTHLGADGLDMLGNMAFYFTTFTSYLELSNVFVAILMVISIGFMWVRKDKKSIVLVSAGIFWWVVISVSSIHWDRWGLPIYASFLLIIAYGFGRFFEYIALSLKGKPSLINDFNLWRKKNQKETTESLEENTQSNHFCSKRCARILLTVLKSAVLVIIIIYLVKDPFAGSLGVDARLVATDTREIAYKYTTDVGINENNAAFDANTSIFLSSSPTQTWTNKTKLVNGILYRNFGVHYIEESSTQEQRYLADTEKYSEIIEEYNWAHQNLIPFYTIQKNETYRPSRFMLITNVRYLIASMFYGQTNGAMMRYYDISSLPIWQTIVSNDLIDEKNGKKCSGLMKPEKVFIYEQPDVVAGSYIISVSGNGDLPVAISIYRENGDEYMSTIELLEGDEYLVAFNEPSELIRIKIWNSSDQAINEFKWVEIKAT